jgi:hypothetical protein
MLAGSATAKSVVVSFNPPDGGGFFCPLAADADGNGGLPAAGTPCPIVSYSDNAWGGGLVDGIQIYQMSVNWVATTPTASISFVSALPTSSFDASYNASWNDISQPGTTQKLDGIGGILNYRAQFRKWNGYNSVVMNWAVKINSTQRSIMWAEIRQNQTSGIWSVYQQELDILNYQIMTEFAPEKYFWIPGKNVGDDKYGLDFSGDREDREFKGQWAHALLESISDASDLEPGDATNRTLRSEAVFVITNAYAPLPFDNKQSMISALNVELEASLNQEERAPGST